MHTFNDENNELKKWLTISLAVHIIAAVIIVLLSSRTATHRKYYTPTYRVNLVTLEKPKRVRAKKAAKVAKVKKKVAAVKKKAKPKVTTKKAKPKSKTGRTTALTKKKVKPTPAYDPAAAIEALRKEVEADMAIEKLKEDIKAVPEEVDEPTVESTPVEQQTVVKLTPDEMDEALKKYYDALWEQIENAWVLPGSGSFEGLVSIVSVTISPSGDLVDLRIEEGSGNGFYDQSALRAIRKSAPFPPLPEGYRRGLEVGFRFKQ